jgi:carbon monoxide dehydrogenase subunit G
MPEHRNFTTFRNLLSGVQKIAKDDPINLSITTKLKLDPVLKKLGFDEMGKNWRLG